MTPFNNGTALSQTESNAKIVPRSSTGTSFEVIERNAGATVGPKAATVAPKYIIQLAVASPKKILPRE